MCYRGECAQKAFGVEFETYASDGVGIHVVDAEHGAVDHGDDVGVGELKSVAGEEDYGVGHEHCGDGPWQSLARDEDGHCGAYAVAQCQAGHHTEDADAVEASHGVEETLVAE